MATRFLILCRLSLPKDFWVILNNIYVFHKCIWVVTFPAVMSINHDIPKETPTDLSFFCPSLPAKKLQGPFYLTSRWLSLILSLLPQIYLSLLWNRARGRKNNKMVYLLPQLLAYFPVNIIRICSYSMLIHEDILYFYAFRFSST